MLVEPIIFTNLYEDKLLLATGEFVDCSLDSSWKFSRPKLYYKNMMIFFQDLKDCINDTDDLYMVHIDSFGLPQLKNLILSKEKVEEANKKGLKIYLTEILLKYQGDTTELYRQDLETVSHDVYKKFRFDYNDNKTNCIQLDNIDTFVKNNNLTNVTACIIEKDYKNIFSHYKNFKVEYNDLFLKYYVKRMKTESNTKNIKYKFLCKNFRYAPHRYLITSFLSNKNSKISWAYKGTIEFLQNLLIFDLSQTKYYDKIKQGIDTLNNEVPLSLDLKYNETNISGSISDQFLLPNTKSKIVPESTIGVYDNIFCSVVAESEFFEVTSNVSEKTLSAIQHKKPFVILGSPNTLQLLKDLGFKTFEKYWSEDYDNYYCSKERFEKVCDVIEFIDSFTIDQCKDMLLDMEDILEHNYATLQKMKEGLTV